MSDPTTASEPPLAPLAGPFDADRVLDVFLAAMQTRGLVLYPEQEEAILELFSGRHVLLKTPTGSGKSLVAGALLFRSLCAGQRAVYTCPIKALVNEKFIGLCREHGPENIGLMTGDATVNPEAPVLCCTAEILANIALCGGPRADIAYAVLDEFHFYDDVERGSAWQIPLLTLPHTQFLLMSATMGHTIFIEEDLERKTGRAAVTVSSERRPVPLEFVWSETPLVERVDGLVKEGKAPIYLVYFTQRSATEAAQDFISLSLCTRKEREHLGEILANARFNSPFGKDLRRWLRHGVGVHHAGLLPKYRLLVESLAQRGLLKLICGTDTLGVGINVPIRTVLFTQLWKYDGRKAATLSVRDFRQIAGRAGRRGYDDRGYVVAQAPEHVIENRRAAEKAGGDAKKLRKLVRKRAPEGQVVWDEKTFIRLQEAAHNNLSPVFEISHGMLLQVLSRDEDGCRVMQRIIRGAHVTPHRKKELKRRAWQLFRSLLERRIVEFVPRQPSGRKLRVNVELQEDFSLHQTLSLYLVDTLALLDVQGTGYCLEVLSLCEAIVENPGAILQRQLDKLKEARIAELKAQGVPYEERIEQLQDMEHPKPMRDFLYDTFNAFKAAHPWVDQENVQPKSIAREMYEEYLSFSEYVHKYGLQRSEGLLLRHLSQVYKVLLQTVPATCKTEPVLEMEAFLRELVRGTDSSLLDEWERLRDPAYQPDDSSGPDGALPSRDLTRDPAALRRAVRAAVFTFLKEVAFAAANPAPAGEDPDDQPLAAFAGFLEARARFLLDPEGRSDKHTTLEEDRAAGLLQVWQTLVDPDGNNDWEALFEVPLGELRESGAVNLELVEVRPIG